MNLTRDCTNRCNSTTCFHCLPSFDRSRKQLRVHTVLQEPMNERRMAIDNHSSTVVNRKDTNCNQEADASESIGDCLRCTNLVEHSAKHRSLAHSRRGLANSNSGHKAKLFRTCQITGTYIHKGLIPPNPTCGPLNSAIGSWPARPRGHSCTCVSEG